MVNDDKENTDSTFRTSFMGTPTKATLLQQSMCDNFNTSQTTPIRPLTAAYKAAQSDHEVRALLYIGSWIVFIQKLSIPDVIK